MHRIAVVVAFALFALPAHAQDYPSRPVEIVVPFAAGGGTDLIARVLAERLSESLKQRFVVINRPGASTNIGTAAVVNAAVDGHTLLLSRKVQAALRSDAVRARIAEQGADVVGGNPESFARFLKQETDRLAAVIRRANIRLD